MNSFFKSTFDSTLERINKIFLYSICPMKNKFHEYFNRNHQSWSILECDLELFY
ncbi:hypothetical protein RhiirA5_357827 [Rhizophagus irregularis]|uniref:Uncharacterized protein n=1 Tax=Rhizophagus irregularis TaxID=588596 RepID=A0A2N0PNZ1_9GLOM|nr:hypothetical protein RhiirA5_357827 [Rhizophagus irregularis]GBC21292.1 hypothetical protein RIR_e14198_A0A2N0PNZ1_9GLOM [Rhizophagus irregularis DAOM 181602=DAOM 197198]